MVPYPRKAYYLVTNNSKIPKGARGWGLVLCSPWPSFGRCGRRPPFDKPCASSTFRKARNNNEVLRDLGIGGLLLEKLPMGRVGGTCLDEPQKQVFQRPSCQELQVRWERGLEAAHVIMLWNAWTLPFKTTQEGNGNAGTAFELSESDHGTISCFLVQMRSSSLLPSFSGLLWLHPIKQWLGIGFLRITEGRTGLLRKLKFWRNVHVWNLTRGALSRHIAYTRARDQPRQGLEWLECVALASGFYIGRAPTCHPKHFCPAQSGWGQLFLQGTDGPWCPSSS